MWKSNLGWCFAVLLSLTWGGAETAWGVSHPDEVGKGSNAVQGQIYTWKDGDITRKVWLQADLVVETVAPGVEGKHQTGSAGRDEVVFRGGNMRIVKRAVRGVRGANEMLVFRGDSGQLMLLPGGVLLVLDSELKQEETSHFFVENGIGSDRVSEIGPIRNAFFIETEAGMPSLNLANELAEKSGVKISSPNWLQRVTLE